MDENEFSRKLANNLAEFRKINGLTQSELADCLNYSDKSISKWEQGNGAPGVFVLLQMSEIFGVTVSELIGQNEHSKETSEKIKSLEKDNKAKERARKKAMERAKKRKHKNKK